MKKRTVYIFIGVICIALGLGWYSSPMLLNDLVSEQIDVKEIEEISINLLSTYSQKEYKVNDKMNVDKIISIFDNVKVRRVISPPVAFRPALGVTYYFSLTSKNKIVPVCVMDKDYLTVMRHTYKIVKGLDIKQIDDIINSLN